MMTLKRLESQENGNQFPICKIDVFIINIFSRLKRGSIARLAERETGKLGCNIRVVCSNLPMRGPFLLSLNFHSVIFSRFENYISIFRIANNFFNYAGYYYIFH